ncbi:MAG: CHAD domain-containing protein [Thermomicrobiales bacterium]|nr:CHAD domain-containing protein [Thermomicrobiales bacterium]
MNSNPTPSISADQPIAEAVRTILGGLLITLRDQEAHYRSDDVVEGVHKMRVSTRRMRTLLRLYGDRFDEAALQEFVPGMRLTARKLGAVRDLDVLIEHLRDYQQNLPDEEQSKLEPLVRHWQERQAKASLALKQYLESKSYRRFLKRLARFTSRPGQGIIDNGGAVVPCQVRHTLGSSIWRRYEAVWAYAPILDHADEETLHALRIECKFLRYSLEFFSDVLGEQKASQLIAPVVALQEHLGDLHDASVAREIMDLAGEPATPARERYLAHREHEVEVLASKTSVLWRELDSARYRRNLAIMLAAL